MNETICCLLQIELELTPHYMIYVLGDGVCQKKLKFIHFMNG
jgi:hypothetical protein